MLKTEFCSLTFLQIIYLPMVYSISGGMGEGHLPSPIYELLIGIWFLTTSLLCLHVLSKFNCPWFTKLSNYTLTYRTVVKIHIHLFIISVCT